MNEPEAIISSPVEEPDEDVDASLPQEIVAPEQPLLLGEQTLAATVPRPYQSKRLSYFARRNAWGYFFVAPAILFFLSFSLYPILSALYLSFFSYDLLTPPQFIGWDNYRYLLESPIFHRSVEATAVYVVGTCVPIWVIAFLLAAALNRAFRLRELYRTLYFLPTILPVVAISIVWNLLYQPYGPINALFHLSTDWLTTETSAPLAMIILSVWKGLGYYTVIFAAGLAAVPQDYIDAARVDGAGGLAVYRRVILPLMRPTFALVVIVSVVVALKVFIPQYIMTTGGPNNSTLVLTLYIYYTAFSYFRMGRAAAMAVFMFLVLMVFSLVQLRVFRSAEQ
jgi:ABC-type sugar transport system permease subunit